MFVLLVVERLCFMDMIAIDAGDVACYHNPLCKYRAIY